MVRLRSNRSPKSASRAAASATPMVEALTVELALVSEA